MKSLISFCKELFGHFMEKNTFQQGAALAYYAVFSILPMIIVVISVLGLFFGEMAVAGEIYGGLASVLGDTGAQQIQDLVKHHHTNHNSKFTLVLGAVTLALSATGMFNQLHSSFNAMWNLKAKPKNGLLRYFKKHVGAFSLLLTLFFILLLSTTINGFLVQHARSLNHGNFAHIVYEHLVSFFVLSVLFTLMFVFLGDARVSRKTAWIGGAFTSLLFILGKAAISLYLGHSSTATLFGSAGVLALLMLWVYYTSQIIFMGASFVYVYGKHIGEPIRPNAGGVKMVHKEVD